MSAPASVISNPSSPKGLRVLITGGCGFIGSNLVRCLIEEKGCEVLNLDKLTYAANPDALKDLENHPNYHFKQLDLSTFHFPSSTVFEGFRPHAVIHLAAESHVDRSIDGPGEFIQTNIVGTYHLLQASLAYWRSLPEAGEGESRNSPDSVSSFSVSGFPPSKKTFRLLHISTDEVYGSLSPSDAPFKEGSLLKPSSPYSASKAAADHLVQAWHHTYGLPSIITRCGNNYGPNQHPEKLIPKVIHCCLNGQPIPVYGTGANIRDWIHVDDHCEALWTVLTDGRIGEIYNIGANQEISNIELVRTLCRRMDEVVPAHQGALEKNLASDFCPLPSDRTYESLISFVTDRPGHDFRYALDTSKICDELNWQPNRSLSEALRATVESYF